MLSYTVEEGQAKEVFLWVVKCVLRIWCHDTFGQLPRPLRDRDCNTAVWPLVIAVVQLDSLLALHSKATAIQTFLYDIFRSFRILRFTMVVPIGFFCILDLSQNIGMESQALCMFKVDHNGFFSYRSLL